MSKETKSEKMKKLEAIKNQIAKKFGDESIKLMDKKSLTKKMPALSTGSLVLDTKLNIGGLPKGRIIEIYGQEASGKTTLTLHVAAECQKAGGTVAFIDAEHALDPIYTKALGVNVEEMLISQPDSGEQAFDIAEAMVDTEAIDLIIIDSVSALTPRAELDGSMDDQQMGIQARMMGKGLRKITAKAQKAGTTIIFINQLREKIGGYGDPRITSGGKALKFYASTRLEVSRVKSKASGVDHTKEAIMKVTVKKHKLGVPFAVAEMPFVMGKGIDFVVEGYTVARELTGLLYVEGRTHYWKGRPVTLENGTVFENDPDGIKNKIATKAGDVTDLIKNDKNFAKALTEQNKERMEGVLDGKTPAEIQEDFESKSKK